MYCVGQWAILLTASHLLLCLGCTYHIVQAKNSNPLFPHKVSFWMEQELHTNDRKLTSWSLHCLTSKVKCWVKNNVPKWFCNTLFLRQISVFRWRQLWGQFSRTGKLELPRKVSRCFQRFTNANHERECVRQAYKVPVSIMTLLSQPQLRKIWFPVVNCVTKATTTGLPCMQVNYSDACRHLLSQIGRPNQLEVWCALLRSPEQCWFATPHLLRPMDVLIRAIVSNVTVQQRKTIKLFIWSTGFQLCCTQSWQQHTLMTNHCSLHQVKIQAEKDLLPFSLVISDNHKHVLKQQMSMFSCTFIKSDVNDLSCAYFRFHSTNIHCT